MCWRSEENPVTVSIPAETCIGHTPNSGQKSTYLHDTLNHLYIEGKHKWSLYSKVVPVLN
jgi:hypothetical protein